MAEYIDRETLRKILENWRDAHADADDEQGCGLLEDVIWEVDAQPAADVAPVVHGRWEWFDEETGTPFTGYEREWGWRCSHCKHELPDDYDDPDYRPMLDYCPNCGAKMDGGDSDADLLALDEIRHAPTVDAVVVTRCKECEHAERYERIDGTVGYYCGHPQNTFTYGERWDRVFKPVKEPDGFCSRGERKDGGADNEM